MNLDNGAVVTFVNRDGKDIVVLKVGTGGDTVEYAAAEFIDKRRQPDGKLSSEGNAVQLAYENWKSVAHPKAKAETKPVDTKAAAAEERRQERENERAEQAEEDAREDRAAVKASLHQPAKHK